MKKLTTIGLLLLISIASTTFNGCKKDKYHPKGDYVKTGTNANTVQNYNFTVSSSQWTYDNLYESWYYKYYNSSNSQSAVLGYVMSGGGEQAMPYQTCPSFMCEQYDFATYLFGSPAYIEIEYTNYNSKTTKPISDKYIYNATCNEEKVGG